MKKNKILLIVCLFFVYSNVLADDSCTTAELNRLKEAAKNVEFTHEYSVREERAIDYGPIVKVVDYNVSVLNLPDDLRLKLSTDSNMTMPYTNFNEMVFDNGQSVSIKIVAYTANECAGKVVLTKTVKLPYFNVYSMNEACLTYPDFKYCSQYGKYNIDDDDVFEKELEEYKKSLSGNGNNIEEPNDIKGFIEKYGLFIAVGSILIIVIVIVFLIIKRKKRGSDI